MVSNFFQTLKFQISMSLLNENKLKNENKNPIKSNEN